VFTFHYDDVTRANIVRNCDVIILGRDEFCGEGCLAEQPKRIATATALMECEIMQIEKDAIVRTLRDEPVFSQMFLENLLARTIRVQEDLVDQLLNSNEKRSAKALLLSANFGRERRPEPIITKVSDETLAEMIGTTPARVSMTK
jgi:CRP/FNR family cyclic AMP-dependent transcriptional regulator